MGQAQERSRMDSTGLYEKDLGAADMNEKYITWFKAAGIRAVRTTAQAAAAVIGTAAVMGEVDWKMTGSTALLAGILSMLTSLAGLPELDNQGD